MTRLLQGQKKELLFLCRPGPVKACIYVKEAVRFFQIMDAGSFLPRNETL